MTGSAASGGISERVATIGGRGDLSPARGHRGLLGLVLAVWVVVGLAVPPAWGQVDLLQEQARQEGFSGEVSVRVESVGPGNAARPGEWAGIRVRLTDRSDRQREVLLRVVMPDVDGDQAHYETVVTTNPGVDQPVWVYARLPFDLPATGGFVVRVFEAEEAPADGAAVGFVAGRLLGQTTQNWGNRPGRTTGLLPVVGRTPGGITGYQQGGQDGANPLGHEVSQIVQITSVDNLPDRWLGLAMVRELIWNGPSPAELRVEQVRALREWIERGGHFVVMLPAAGQDWLALGNQELASVLPRVSVSRVADEPPERFRELLTDEPAVRLSLPDRPVTVHIFEPLADAGPGEADPVLVDAEGRCVVVTRSVGVGAVTFIGLPGWYTGITNLGLPEADVFWHRVLGRRGKVATETEAQQLRDANQLLSGVRSARTLDADISAFIGKSGRSLVAVLLGLVVFIVYWLVAGPGGFGYLKLKGLSRHAWLAFLGASIVFTGLSWTGAAVLRPKRVEIAHLSYLDHVYGQRVQRVRTWASVLAPVYGDASVWLDSDDAAAMGSRFQHAVAPWEPSQATVRGSFPDAREYSIDSRAPDRLTFPARATVKQVQLDWAGGVSWESIRPVFGTEEDPFSAVRFAPPGEVRHVLDGALVHGLPAALENVQIVVFRRQQPVRPSINKASLLTVANAWSLPEPWEPGMPLDLSAATTTVGTPGLAARLDALVGASGFGEDNLPSAGSRTDRFLWLSFFNLIGAPPPPRNFQPAPVARRDATHTLDLSRWSTRPCLVVLGVLRAEGEGTIALPVGVATNGRERTPVVSGVTIVRWVYPLPPDPPEAPRAEDTPPEAPGQ